MSTINKIADGVIWTIASKFVSAAYSFVAVPILIGLYGKADYGLIGLALSINVYMTLLDLGFQIPTSGTSLITLRRTILRMSGDYSVLVLHFMVLSASSMH